MLFDPARHEALEAAPWDEARVRAAVAAIVCDTVADYRPGRWWPAHPDDVGPGDDPAQPFTPLYFGAAGVIWALQARAFGMHAIGQSEADVARFGQRRHSLWTGDPGLACYLWSCLRAQVGFPTLDRFYPI